MRRAAARSRRCDVRFSVVYCILHAKEDCPGGEERVCFVCALGSNAHCHYHISRGRAPVASGVEPKQPLHSALCGAVLVASTGGGAPRLSQRGAPCEIALRTRATCKARMGSPTLAFRRANFENQRQEADRSKRRLNGGKHVKGSPLLEDERRL
jgi:hypothetical protein